MSLTKATFSMVKGSYVNVFDYMTAAQIADVEAGTLTIDVRDAIQSAFRAAWNYPTGTGRKVVYFPNGKYRVDSTISIAGISLLGESMSGSEIYYYGIDACLTNSTGENFIENLTFDGTNANVGSSIGIEYDTTLRHTLRKNIIRNFFRGIKITGTAAYGNLFTENYFIGNKIHVYTEAIGSGQFPTDCWFSENEFNGATDPNYAIYLQDSEGFTFERNTIQNNQSKFSIFIYYFSALTNAYMNHRIINNWFEENGNSQVGSADIKVLGSYGAVKGIVIENNQHYTTTGNNPTYGVHAENTDALTVLNNTWNLGSPWIYLHKAGSGNKNWVVDNPQVASAQEMKKHIAVLGKSTGTAQTVNAAANDVILFDAPLDNFSGLWNTGTGEFTAAAKGRYKFALSISFENSLAAQQFNLTVLIGGAAPSPALAKQCIKAGTGVETFEFIGYLSLNVGNVVTFKCENTGGTARNIAVNSQGSIELMDYVR